MASSTPPQCALLYATMSRLPKWFVSLLVLAVASLGIWIFMRSDADRVRDELAATARVLEFDSQPPPPNWLDRLRQAASTRIADPLALDLAPFGESRVNTEALIESYLTYTRDLNSLHISLRNVGIVLDEQHGRATAKGDAQLERVLSTGEHEGEPRKFVATLEKASLHWRVVHLRVSEPRIDQPEARP
jgi:hypothetical protein